jgi:apolipoprotein N-acyltransferase
VSEYLKNYLVADDNHILGDGIVLIQDSDYGKLASIICQDTHSPGFVRQAGKVNADIILIPNHNWEAINPLAARMASFRAIENGFSMIRADYHGLCTAVDYHGNILSQMNDFTTEERIMIADIPKQDIKTIYSQIGDFFAWLCVLGFLSMIWLSFSKFKKI